MALTYILKVSVDGLVTVRTLMIWTDLPDCGLDLYKEGECGRIGLCDDTDDLDGLCNISSSSSSPVDEKLK